MGRSNRERQRVKRARKRKQRALEAVRRERSAIRAWRGMGAAAAAEGHLAAGDVDGALAQARRAAALSPRDPEIATLHLAAAERAGDLDEQRAALEHLIRLVEPDARRLIRLAYLWVLAGDPARARDLAARGRALLPRRVAGRRQWLSLLEYVEMMTAGVASVAGQASSSVTSTRAPARQRDADPRLERGRTRAVAAAAARAPDAGAAGGAGASGSARSPSAHPPAAGGGQPRMAGAASGHDRRPCGAADAIAAAEPVAMAGEPPAPPPAFEIPIEIAAAIAGIGDLDAAPGALEDVALASLAARIRDAESYDRLLALERAEGLVRLSHQEETARRVLARLLGRALLADEVGLGKTIEAGIVLAEYRLRGRVDRALVLAPPSLVRQWREELASKFGIDARTTEDAAFRADPAAFWSAPGVAIASLPTARGPRHREIVTARPWDLVIVDEAHQLKNARTEAYALVAGLTARFLLLLTATPVENRVEELYNLVSLLRPGHLGGRREFVRRFGGARGRVTETARREVRALLGELMIRNTRALSGVRLPPRFARTVLVEPDPGEGALYEHVALALRALAPSGRTRFLFSVLLQEAGSSPHAVRATLEKVRAGGEHDAQVRAHLGPALEALAEPPRTGKATALVRVLADREPTVVFTRFRATLDLLAQTLAAAGLPCERMDGGVPVALRRQAVERAQAAGGVLLATDVGSEGLNLQAFRRVVNFDLPWNPMRIEQRIGRIHRIGQEHPVEVVTLCLAGSIEERILQILDERINLFELVVGEIESILGYLEDERALPDLALDAFAEPEAAGRERAFVRIGDALAAARRRYQGVKRFDEALFRNELGV